MKIFAHSYFSTSTISVKEKQISFLCFFYLSESYNVNLANNHYTACHLLNTNMHTHKYYIYTCVFSLGARLKNQGEGSVRDWKGRQSFISRWVTFEQARNQLDLSGITRLESRNEGHGHVTIPIGSKDLHQRTSTFLFLPGQKLSPHQCSVNM